MTRYTHLKLKPEYRDKLKALADRNKRSMAEQLQFMIDREPKVERLVDHLIDQALTELPRYFPDVPLSEM